MKVQLLTLLLLLLCSTQVLTLRCYTCDDDNDIICKTEKDCPTSAAFCKTWQKGDQISRTCEELCGKDFYTYCCKEDLCTN